MRVVAKDQITEALVTPTGERIYELIGKTEESGGTSKHSLALVIIPPGKSSAPHFHKDSEETYYVLNGEGWMQINEDGFTLSPGQACLIEPGEIHQIINKGEIDLEFLAVFAPAWVAEDSLEVDG